MFKEGPLYQWIELVKDLMKIWTQNSGNGPTDRTTTTQALPKGEHLTAFETALQDVHANLDPIDDLPYRKRVGSGRSLGLPTPPLKHSACG